MSAKWALVAWLVVCGFSARGFVVEVNSNGDPLRWHLDPPYLPDPPNEGGISTNVVNPVTKAVRFFLAADAYSTTNTVAELNAIRASFAQWQSVSGTLLKFEDAGLVAPGVDVNTSDNQNVVFWCKTNTLVNGSCDDVRGALAVTFNSYFSDNNAQANAQAEADIVFNGVQYTWSSDFNSTDTTKQFIESTATHEIGHLLGLKHSPVGGATMLFHGGGGVNVQAGLSSDEIAAAKFLYGQSTNLATLGRLNGQVTMNGSGVFGAAVLAEDAASGNLVAGTVTRADGTYDLPAMPPGRYGLRVTPLDWAGANAFLIRGRDINSDQDIGGNYIYDSVQTSFLPTANVTVTNTAGMTGPKNFAVTSGNPAFRITRIRAPGNDPNPSLWSPFPVAIHPGESNVFVGVGSLDMPTNEAFLTIAGDGITMGSPVFTPNALQTGMNFISVPIDVASNATPGLRSFVVRRGTDTACANGFLDLRAAIPDFNFDGLDDRFQRQYFSLFTAPEAGPNVDADGDRFSNQAEYVAGTDPTNALSLLKIDSVVLSAQGSTLTWQSVAGRRYQVFSRRDLETATWQPAGSPVTADGASAAFQDLAATDGFRFYRVQVLP